MLECPHPRVVTQHTSHGPAAALELSVTQRDITRDCACIMSSYLYFFTLLCIITSQRAVYFHTGTQGLKVAKSVFCCSWTAPNMPPPGDTLTLTHHSESSSE